MATKKSTATSTESDKPREAQQATDEAGNRKPTSNELLSAARGFKAEMAAAGASEDDINAALKEAEGYSAPPLHEAMVGNHGVATPYTTPSSFALVGVPDDVKTPKDESVLPGGTDKQAVS